MTSLDDFTVGRVLSYKKNKNPKKSMANSKDKGLLKKFRLSKKYRLLKGSAGIFKDMNCSDNSKKSNIFDKAESLITNYLVTGKLESAMKLSEEQQKFSDVILSYLVNFGLDFNLIEVQGGDNGSILVYLDETFDRHSVSLREILKNVAKVEKIQVPSDDLSIGAYVFKITPADKNADIPKEFFVKDKEQKAERAAFEFLKGKKIKKKGKLLKDKCESLLNEHDYTIGTEVYIIDGDRPVSAKVVDIKNFGTDAEVYYLKTWASRVLQRTPDQVYPSLTVACSKNNLNSDPYYHESANPKPVKGEILIDSTSRQPFKVIDVIGRSTKIQGLKSVDKQQIVPTIDLERSIVSGKFRRLSESHTKSEKYSRCVNCFSDLIKIEDTQSYECFSCGFHAKFLEP